MWFEKNKQTESPNQNPGGIDFDTAAARVTAESLPNPEEDPGLYEQPGDGNPNAPEDESSERLEIRPEWAVFLARSPYAIVSKFYHPAFALSDQQAEKLGPKILPLIRKVTDVWIPSWLAGVSNRNPEMFDAVAALAVTGFFQWQTVQKIQQAEAEAAANAKPVRGERVTEMPLRSEPGVDERIAGQRLADGSLVI
jgi:hypothetical protein